MSERVPVLRQPESDLRTAFSNDVVAAFSGRPYTLPTKYLYDERGSMLFANYASSAARYYPHAEEALIELYHEDVSKMLLGRQLVEFGAGACPRLLQLLSLGLPGSEVEYKGLDISPTPMTESLETFCWKFKSLKATACIGDFESWPLASYTDTRKPSLFLWFGNTASNMSEQRLIATLRQVSANMDCSANLLLGIDLAGEQPDVKSRFPDDENGFFDQFRWNALTRLNREFGADFRADDFQLHLGYNHELTQAESFFVPHRAQSVMLRELGMTVDFAREDRFVVGITRDLTQDSLTSAVIAGGWTILQIFTMPGSTYALVHLNCH